MASIFKRTRKRKDGTTYTVWVAEEIHIGKTKTFTGKTKKEVEAKLHDWTKEIQEYGMELDKTKYTISDLVYKHLFVNVYPNTQSSTFERYMDNYNKHIKDTDFGNLPINDVKQVIIQEFINDNATVSDRTLTSLRFLLKNAYQFAINNNLVRINPVIGIKIPKDKNKEKRRKVEVLTVDEQKKYMAVLNTTKHKLIFLTALFTGMRRGELLALNWNNVDFCNNVIKVRESLRRSRIYNSDGTYTKELEFKLPKTDNSIRDIPIPQELVTLLKEHKDKQKSVYNPKNLVFITNRGLELNPENIRLIQIRLCKNANIPYKNFHALRHTFATRLVEAGKDIKTISKLLGHSDISITLNTYVHDTLDSKTDAVNALANMFDIK